MAKRICLYLPHRLHPNLHHLLFVAPTMSRTLILQYKIEKILTLVTICSIDSPATSMFISRFSSFAYCCSCKVKNFDNFEIKNKRFVTLFIVCTVDCSVVMLCINIRHYILVPIILKTLETLNLKIKNYLQSALFVP